MKAIKIIVIDDDNQIVQPPITHQRIAKLRGSLQKADVLDVLAAERLAKG